MAESAPPETLYQGEHLRLVRTLAESASLEFDVADRSVNVLGRAVLAELRQALAHPALTPPLQFLLVSSRKPSGFLAGADLQEFASIGPAEAQALSAEGQALFDQLERLPLTTVAVIHGPCLGGGLELALACDYRLVLDLPGTQLGLPEVELGLIPGWGGTQRLPGVVGLEHGLRMVLSGKRLRTPEALRWGLVDAVVAWQPEQTELTAAQRASVLALARRGKRRRRPLPLRSARQWLVESTGLGRSLIFRGSERLLRRKLADDLPAPFEALAAVRVGQAQGRAAGLAREQDAIGRLVTTPACRHLVRLFLERETTRKLPASLPPPSRPIRRVGVVGAGTMGAGVAQLAAFKGCDVVLQEVNDTALARGRLQIALLFQQAAQRGLVRADEARRRLDSIQGTLQWQGFDSVDLVVEAAVEDPDVKRGLFRELGQRTRPDTLLTTNTSALSVAALQEVVPHPERVAGLHFFNPVARMPLVELARADRTAPETVAALFRWAAALGKSPVIVRDAPGFLVNRVLSPYLGEAVLLVAEGLEVEEIDGLMRRFGMPVGPLELLDQVGLDVALQIAYALKPVLGERLAGDAGFLQLCERGWLGRKRGAGFYRYAGNRRMPHPEATEVLRSAAPQARSAEPASAQPGTARERLVLTMVNEALNCVGEQVVDDAPTADLAMVLGTGWAPHRGGPVSYAEDRGYAEVARVLDELARRFGPRFTPCAELRRRSLP